VRLLEVLLGVCVCGAESDGLRGLGYVVTISTTTQRSLFAWTRSSSGCLTMVRGSAPDGRFDCEDTVCQPSEHGYVIF